MATTHTDIPQAPDRDGTSQEQRFAPALLPEYAALDGRSLQDWLELAYQFAKELNYFNLDNTVSGDWRKLLHPDPGIDRALWFRQVEDFVNHPENYVGEDWYNLHRPHFVLFLTFLQLLKNTQAQLNQVSARHLDFYFRKVLQFTGKPPQADRIHILATPSPQVSQALLPIGTLLDAGKDSLGNNMAYRTDEDLVINHSQIAKLCSVYVNQQVIGIREAFELTPGILQTKVMPMLKTALGEPEPGGDLPLYANKTQVDFPFLTNLYSQVDFVASGLFMELGELRSLIQLKQSCGPDADNDWKKINVTLTQAGAKRIGSKNFALKNNNPTDRNFIDNLKDALGVPSLDDYFNTLNLIKNIDQLYEQYTSPDVLNRDELEQFIQSKLYLVPSAFSEMMRLKRSIDRLWQDVFTLLDKAGRRKTKDFRLAIPIPPPDFDSLFQSALGKPKYPQISGLTAITDLASFYQALLAIETYFFMPLEKFRSFMAIATGSSDADNPLPVSANPAWPPIYQDLTEANQKKISLSRLNQLKQLQPTAKTLEQQQLAVQSMLQLALGLPKTDTINLLTRIKAYLTQDANTALLDTVSNSQNSKILTDDEWLSLCSQFELAWRNREPILPPQQSDWLSIRAFDDTASAKAPSGSDSGRWYTFGQRQPQKFSDEQKPPSPAALGWAISSPVLCLAQGKRTVRLTLGFAAASFPSTQISQLIKTTGTLPFGIAVTTEKGWSPVNSYNVSVESYPGNAALPALSWQINFDESAPALESIADPSAESIGSPWPSIRLLLQPRWDEDKYVTDYNLFKNLILEAITLTVDVSGFTRCKLQNDIQTLPPGSPFEPFGTFSVIGSRFYFADAELAAKKLAKLELQLPWMGVPGDNLGAYYQNYTVNNPDPKKTDPVPIQTGFFKAGIFLADQHLEVPIVTDLPLFSDKASTPATLAVANVATAINENNPGLNYDRRLDGGGDDEFTTWPQYFFLELSGCDFQHQAYPSVAAAMGIKLAADMATSKATDPKSYLVNPPYTPKLKNFTINYSASIELDKIAIQKHETDRIYHIHPFGNAAVSFDQDLKGYRFLPPYENEGELYIGLSGVETPQTLSILVQFAEGTANPDLPPASVDWSVLDGDGWRNLDQGQILQDGTHNFLHSGIIKFKLDKTAPSSLLPADSYWLRASINKRCDSVCDMVGIHTQAVSAIFFDQGNAPDHLNQPLAPNSIKNPVTPVAGIESVTQPYTSFSGKPEEAEFRFNTRISERLRHKQRAVNYWDYEHLVLEQFPEIYKVKCIPAGANNGDSQVTVIVIPDIRNRLPFNPFEPKSPSGTLLDIEDYLNSYAPLGASVNVANARFYPVRLRFAVKFQPGSDTGFCKQQLNEAINRFLAPWAYEQGKDIVIGGKIYANAIIDFIERQEYVDYVAHFKLFKGNDAGTGFNFIQKPELTASAEGYAVSANRPDTVLVPALNHDIDLVTEINFGEQLFNNGINYMKIELDFVVG